MKEYIRCQRLYGLILMLSFIFLSDALSLKGKRLDFYGRADMYVSLTNTIPELTRFTACIDLVFVDDKSSNWMAFSYITNNAFLGREDINLGLGGDHQQLILHNLGKTFYIRYHLTPFQWYTVCLMWDGVKGRLELFLNTERILVMMDQPQNLTPNGTLILGHSFMNWDSQVESALPGFTGSLYYFQLWDHIVENEEFMKCLGGNVVSWEEDVWLINKIIPTVDMRLRCFVSENITIQEMSTTLSQQIDLTTPSQVTGLKPQETINSSTVFKSMPVFAADYTAISYSNTTSPPLEAITAPKFLKTPVTETTRFTADILSTSAAITLPTKSTSIGTTTNSMKVTKPPSSDSTRTTKMAEAIATETLHPTTAANFLYTSGLSKNSIISKTSVTESQSTIMKTSLFSSAELTSISPTSWLKHKSTGIEALSISTARQEFLASTAAGTLPWSTVEHTSATTTHVGTALAFIPESVHISTVAPEGSVFPRNQTASTLATTNMEIASPVHSKTLPTRPIEMMPVLRTTETKLTSTNFQEVSSPRMEDTVSTSIPKKASSVALSFRTSTPFTGTLSLQPVIDAETTHTALTLGVTLAPMATDTLLPPIIPRPIYTQNTPTGGGNMLPLNSTRSASTFKASESGPTSITDDGTHLFSTIETTQTSRPDQTLLTSAFHASNTGHSSTTSTPIIPPEAPSESKATTITGASITAGTTTDRYAKPASKLTTLWYANFSTILGTTSITQQPEFKLTTLQLKPTPLSIAAESELPSTLRETFVPPVGVISTLANIEPNVSTEESASETTVIETNGTVAFGETIAPVPESATTQRCSHPVIRIETTSHYLEGKSTIAVTTELSPFATMLEATDESAQMVTASVTASPFPDIEKLTTLLDNKTTTTEVRGSWLSTKLMTTTSKNSYDGTTEIFNSTHTHTAHWTSEAPPVGDPTPSPIFGSTQTFPELLGTSTTRILGTSFATVLTDMIAMSLSAGVSPPQPTATHSSATPAPSATVTTTSVSPLDQTASTTRNTVPTHRHSIHTTSEATVFSVRMTPTTVPSLTDTPVLSWRPPTPVATMAETTFLFPSADTVTPFTPTLVCSKSLPDSIPVVSSTHVTSTMFTPVATQPMSQREETSTHALSLPYTLNSSGDIVSLATSTIETSVVDETMPSHTSTNKLTVDGHISQSSTRLGNILVPTLLVTDVSTLSSDKEQMTISLGNTSRTVEVTEMSPSENPFISDSQSISSLEMTHSGFAETTTISSRQTHSPSEFPLATSPDRISASSPISGTTQTIPTSILSHSVNAHNPEMSTSLGKTALPSQALTITTLLSPEKESIGTLSVYTPRTEKMIVSATSVTHLFSYHQDTSFVDTVTSRTTRISNPVNVNTTLSYLLSPKTQTKISVASSISESMQTSPESLSLSTTGQSHADFTIVFTDGITIVLSTPNAPTALLEKTPVATHTLIDQVSSLPVSVPAVSSKRVSATPTILITKYSKTAHPDCLKSPSIATSGPVSEMPSMSVNGSAFSPPAVSIDTSTTVGSFSSLLSSTTPRTTMALQTSTLDVAPGPTSKRTLFSSTSITSEMTEVSSRITPTSFSSLTQSTFPSVKTIPTTVTVGTVTPSIGTTASSLLSSKNTGAISSISKTTFSPFQSTTQQLSQRDETTTLGMLSGTANGSLSPVSSSIETALTNTYSRTAALESVLSSTPSDNLHTSLNIEVSPSLTSSKNIPGPTKSVKATTYLSLNTEKMTSLSENSSAAELTKGATSVDTPVSYPLWTPSIATPPSLTSFLFSPHSTEAKFSTPETFLLLTSQMAEFPVLGTRITSSNTKSLLMTSWDTPTAKGSQFPISATTRIPTPHKMETETPYLVPGSLLTFTASQTGLVSEDVMAKSSISMPGSLPTLGMSDSPSSSISSRSIPITLADIKPTFEKTATSVTPGTRLTLNPSGATSGSMLSEATSSPILAWILSTLPLGPPLVTVSNSPHITSMVEVSKSTFLTSDTTPMHSFTNFTTLPFAAISTALTKTTPAPTVGSITAGFPISLPMSIKITDASTYISKFTEASSRTIVTANSRTVSQPLPFSRMSRLPPATDHTLSISSTFLPSPTVTSAWSKISPASASPTLVLPKPMLDSLPNITASTLTATTASFPLTSTGVTHPSTATVSSLLSSSSETTWLDSTSSFLSMETSTSLIATKSTVSFYNIEMSFSVLDEEPRIPIISVVNEFAENWLNSIFQDSEFAVANLVIKIKSRGTSEGKITMDQTVREGQGMATISHVLSSYVCRAILKASSSLAAIELMSRIKSKIHDNLTHGNFTQGQLTLLVKSEHVVEKLEPGKCEAQETVSKYKGTYKWLLTNPTETAQTRCIKNRNGNATRICSINMNTGKSQWEKPKLKQCKLLQGLPDKIMDLANITISDENADDVAEHILNLINESPLLDEEETKIIVSKVSDVSQCNEISMNLTQVILQIINAILGKQNNSASDLHEVRNEILRIIERAGHKMEFSGRTANLMVARLALAVLRVDHTFEGMAFSIHSYEEGTDPEIYLGEVPPGRVLASIYLPQSLRERIPLSSLQTILFNFFGQTSLFKTRNVTKALSTFVVSASISDTSIQNLAEPVVITLQHVEGNQSYDQVHCAFWDFGSKNGQGGWNSSGCKVKETNENHTICQCDHLTHFGVLLDLSRSAVDAVNEQILVLITYIGCGISSIFLGVAMVTYIAFHKLRKDHPSKILINLCTALLMLNLTFLVNSWSSSFQKAGLCVTAAMALHYFLLVSLTWMGLEAVHMYLSLVRVFNIYVPNYILKFCLVGWGIPGVMVAITLSVKKDLYGTLSSTTPFCWIKDDSIFYTSVVAYFCLIFLMNLSMFCTVLAQLNSMNSQSRRTRRKMILHDLKGTTSLTFLLGLTWGFAFFAWGPVRIFFLYLFAIFNTLQGFLIFMFYCVMKESVREQWQIHFCCGWLRLDNSSDRDSRCGLHVGYKQERLKKTFQKKLLTPSLKSTMTSSTLKSLGSAQCTLSEICFPNGDFDEDPYCFSPLSCEVVPNYVRRILPVEVKMNSTHKQRFLE
ncbi:adhesion G-protein coupled receptor G4 isoform X4 [Canis lupus familiaris]|uniref:adhesion G-protein coupled receptor G4 isoform X4 n=1 Tax=Canis lupus familiaris TaxID=9615 RepID=UPI0015F17065|nr:adhesion G-protein coupled receptor G4 isoform X4 [Canis lupus familiaris]